MGDDWWILWYVGCFVFGFLVTPIIIDKIEYILKYRNGWYSTPNSKLDKWFKMCRIPNNAGHLQPNWLLNLPNVVGTRQTWLIPEEEEGNYLNGYELDTCKHCTLKRTPAGHDGCIGTLLGVANACCGHGEDNTAYVQFWHEDYDTDSNKHVLRGEEAIEYININRGIR